MAIRHLEGVGEFHKGDGYWESEPVAMHGSLISIESEEITPAAESRARLICETWDEILQICARYIEKNRTRYELLATNFSNPNVFIDEDTWSVYFDTEVELQAIVGVDFKGEEPFQLIVGD